MTAPVIGFIGAGNRVKKFNQPALSVLKDKFEIIDNIDNFKGFNRLPPQNNNDLFFDIEGDPTSNKGLEYLFGLIIKDKNKTASGDRKFQFAPELESSNYIPKEPLVKKLDYDNIN